MYPFTCIHNIYHINLKTQKESDEPTSILPPNPLAELDILILIGSAGVGGILSFNDLTFSFLREV